MAPSVSACVFIRTVGQTPVSLAKVWVSGSVDWDWTPIQIWELGHFLFCFECFLPSGVALLTRPRSAQPFPCRAASSLHLVNRFKAV